MSPSSFLEPTARPTDDPVHIRHAHTRNKTICGGHYSEAPGRLVTVYHCRGEKKAQKDCSVVYAASTVLLFPTYRRVRIKTHRAVVVRLPPASCMQQPIYSNKRRPHGEFHRFHHHQHQLPRRKCSSIENEKQETCINEADVAASAVASVVERRAPRTYALLGFSDFLSALSRMIVADYAAARSPQPVRDCSVRNSVVPPLPLPADRVRQTGARARTQRLEAARRWRLVRPCVVGCGERRVGGDA